MKMEPNLEAMLQQVELRVLYGPQAGSRLTLSPGDYDLGSGDECTVILSGPRMEESHAHLSYDGSRPAITPLDGKVCDAQGNEITDTFPLTLGMPVELGGVWIAIDEVDAAWPDPSAVSPILAAPPVPVPQTEDLSALEAGARPKTSDDIQRKRARLALAMASVILGIVAVAGLGVAAWLLKKQTALETPTIPAAETAARLEKLRGLLATVAAGQAIEVRMGADHKPIVEGYVRDSATRERIAQRLSDLSPQPTVLLYADADLLQAARQLLDTRLDQNRARLRTDAVNNGVLTVQGAVASQSVRESVTEMLQAGIPGLKGISGNVFVAEDLPAVFMERLAEAGLARKVQVTSKQPELTLRGALNSEEMKRWEQLLLAFTEDYGKVLPIRASITQVQYKLPVNVQTIVGGTIPFVTTESGQRITRGGDINGHTLVTVKDNEVVFEGNERIKIGR